MYEEYRSTRGSLYVSLINGCSYFLQDYLGRPRNVVLYGECGMGLINLITRRDITATSLDARTATHPPYHVNIKGQCFKLWDTTAGWRFFYPEIGQA
jgi:hypothetical protein